jgi:hypothetical protein
MAICGSLPPKESYQIPKKIMFQNNFERNRSEGTAMILEEVHVESDFSRTSNIDWLVLQLNLYDYTISAAGATGWDEKMRDLRSSLRRV